MKKEIEFYEASEIYKQIAFKYCSPSYALLCELRDGTGYATAGRSADAVAMGTWPSRGLQIIGFEIKSFRHDWLSELRNPAKADAIGAYCDLWFLVATEDVAKLEEIPATWGWYTPTTKGLKCLKQPEQMKPCDIDRLFLASLLRNLTKNYIPKVHVDQRIDDKVKEHLEREKVEREYQIRDMKQRCEAVDAFEKASGLKIEDGWRYGGTEIGATLKAILDHDLPRHIETIRDASKSASDLLAIVEAMPFLKKRENAL